MPLREDKLGPDVNQSPLYKKQRTAAANLATAKKKLDEILRGGNKQMTDLATSKEMGGLGKTSQSSGSSGGSDASSSSGPPGGSSGGGPTGGGGGPFGGGGGTSPGKK